MEQIIQSMQQIKAAASVAKPTLPPKRTPLATPSAPPPAPVATPQPEPAQPVPASEAEQSSAPTSSAKLLEPSRPSAAAERQPVATGVGQLSALAANAKSAVDSVPSAFNDTSDHLLQQKTKSHASDQTELVPSTSQASAPHKAAAINATQAGPVTAGADQVALGATGSQADAIGAKPSLDTKPPKDSKSHKETRAQRESRDSGDKRSRGKEKDSSKGKHGKKDKRSSRGERRRSISRSRSRFPKRYC